MVTTPARGVASTQGSEAPTAPNGWSWEVLRGFRAGERAALTEVYRLHAREIAGLLRHGFSFRAGERSHRFVGYRSGFELQDALHETFRRAFEPGARMSYDGVRPYAPYLRTIARNVVLKTFRAREVLFPEVEGARVDALDVVPTGPSAPKSPEVAVHEEQVRQLVRAFLETLGSADRRLITLRFIEGRSQRDVAELLGIGRQRVRGREAKLRARLIKHLQRQGEAGLLSTLVPLLGAALAPAITEALR